jgi:chromosome segregation ATPase
LAKVSEQMAELSQRAKAAEERSAETRTQTRDEIEGRISEVRADLPRRRREMQARQAEIQDDLGTWWSNLGATINEHLDRMRNQIDEQRDDHDAKGSEPRADRA